MLPFSPKYLRYFTLCIEMLLVNGADRQNCLAVYGKQCTPGKFTLIVSDSMTQHLQVRVRWVVEFLIWGIKIGLVLKPNHFKKQYSSSSFLLT